MFEIVIFTSSLISVMLQKTLKIDPGYNYQDESYYKLKEQLQSHEELIASQRHMLQDQSIAIHQLENQMYELKSYVMRLMDLMIQQQQQILDTKFVNEEFDEQNEMDYQREAFNMNVTSSLGEVHKGLQNLSKSMNSVKIHKSLDVKSSQNIPNSPQLNNNTVSNFNINDHPNIATKRPYTSYLSNKSQNVNRKTIENLEDTFSQIDLIQTAIMENTQEKSKFNKDGPHYGRNQVHQALHDTNPSKTLISSKNAVPDWCNRTIPTWLHTRLLEDKELTKRNKSPPKQITTQKKTPVKEKIAIKKTNNFEQKSESQILLTEEQLQKKLNELNELKFTITPRNDLVKDSPKSPTNNEY